MRDRSDRYHVEAVPSLARIKRLGSYLLEAGLLTPDQIDVALRDQKATGMRFGEILVARGWVKEKTIEWMMQKVILPEKQARQKQLPPSHESSRSMPLEQEIPNKSSAAKASGPPTHPPGEQSGGRVPPISKPLPSVKPKGEDVNWVG
jgi:hypothetical protein